MSLYCYSAEALNPDMVRSYQTSKGLIHGFVPARSQSEAIYNAMNEVRAYIYSCEDYDKAEMSIHENTKYGSITIHEIETGKVINHIQRFAVHEC